MIGPGVSPSSEAKQLLANQPECMAGQLLTWWQDWLNYHCQ